MIEDNSASMEANENLDTEVIDNEQVVDQKEEGLTADHQDEAEATPEAKKQKQIDNAESSRIGRIVKNQLLKETAPLLDEIKTLRSTVERLTPKENFEASKPPVEGFPTTPEEFRAMKRWTDEQDARERAEQIAVYERGYISSINSLREEGGELHAQIQELLTKDDSPYNVTHGTGRGDVDAALNYRMAHRDIIANKIKENRNPFKGNTNNVATGVTASSRVPTTKSLGKTKFDDPRAEEFAKYLNYSDEDRAKIISGKK